MGHPSAGLSMDWIRGKFTGLSPIFNGKIYGFRLRFSLKPIHWDFDTRRLNIHELSYIDVAIIPARKSTLSKAVLYSPLPSSYLLEIWVAKRISAFLENPPANQDLSKPKLRQLIVGRVQVDQSARAFQPEGTFCQETIWGLPALPPKITIFSKGKGWDPWGTILDTSLIICLAL